MSPVPASCSSLSGYLKQHLASEQGALDAYTRLLDGRPDDLVTYLVRLILRDEERHHELFLEIRNSLESAVEWSDMTPRGDVAHRSPSGFAAIMVAPCNGDG